MKIQLTKSKGLSQANQTEVIAQNYCWSLKWGDKLAALRFAMLFAFSIKTWTIFQSENRLNNNFNVVHTHTQHT